MLPVVLKVLNRFEIRHRLFSIVADNASVNSVLMDQLAATDGLDAFQGEKTRIRCFTHIINLMIQGALNSKNPTRAQRNKIAKEDHAVNHEEDQEEEEEEEEEEEQEQEESEEEDEADVESVEVTHVSRSDYFRSLKRRTTSFDEHTLLTKRKRIPLILLMRITMRNYSTSFNQMTTKHGSPVKSRHGKERQRRARNALLRIQ